MEGDADSNQLPDADRHFEDFTEIVKDNAEDRRRRVASSKSDRDDGGGDDHSVVSAASSREFWTEREQQQILSNSDHGSVGGFSTGGGSVASALSQEQQHQHRRFRKGKKKPSSSHHNEDSLDRRSSHSTGSVYSAMSQQDFGDDDDDSYQKDMMDDDYDDDIMDLAVNDIAKIYTASATTKGSPKTPQGTNYEPSFNDSFYDSMDFWADKDKRSSVGGSKSPRTPGGGRRFFTTPKKPNSFSGPETGTSADDDNNATNSYPKPPKSFSMSSAISPSTTNAKPPLPKEPQQQQQRPPLPKEPQQQQQQQDAGTATTTPTIYSLTPPQTPEQFEKGKAGQVVVGGGGSSISSGSATKTPKKSKSTGSRSSTPKTPKSSTPKSKRKSSNTTDKIPKTPKKSLSTPKKSKSAGASSTPKGGSSTPKSRSKMKAMKGDDIVAELPVSPKPSKKEKDHRQRSTTPPRSPRSKSKERGKRSTSPTRSPRSKSKERGKRSTTPPRSPRSPKVEKDKLGSADGDTSKRSPKQEKKKGKRDVTPPRTRPKSPIVEKTKLDTTALSKSPRKPKSNNEDYDVAVKSPTSKSRKDRKLGKKRNSKRNLMTEDDSATDENNSKNGGRSKKNNKKQGSRRNLMEHLEGGNNDETTTSKKKKNKKQSSKRNLMADLDSFDGSEEASAVSKKKNKKLSSKRNLMADLESLEGSEEASSGKKRNKKQSSKRNLMADLDSLDGSSEKKDKKDRKKDRSKKTPRKSNLIDDENEEAAEAVSASIHDLLNHMEKSTTLLVSKDDEGDGVEATGELTFDSEPEKKKKSNLASKEIDETTSDEIRAFKEKGGDGAYPVPLSEEALKQKGKRQGQKHTKKKENVRKDESADGDDKNEESKPKHPPVRFKNVQGESLFSPKKTYRPPVFKKSVVEQQMIEKSFRENPAFEGIVPSTKSRLIDAFEKVEVDKGATVAEEGGKEDKLFVVQQGEVSFHNRGIQIGTGEVGATFGQMALKLPVQRDVEVKAEKDHTVLFQLDHNNYREILRYETTREEEKRRELLRDVPFFKDVTNSDLKQLGNAMRPHNFKQGDDLTALYAESPFCLVVKGSLSIRDMQGTGGGGTEVGPGEVFGEEIFSSKDTRRVHIEALTDGRACTITREDFEKVFGDMGRIAGKARDKKILSEIKSIKAAKLSDADMDALVRQISNVKYESHENIFTIDEHITPALYLVRLGKVEIIKRNGTKETKVAGEYFGHYHVISAEEGGGGHHTVPTSVKAKYTAAPVGDTVCAVLTLQELATIVAGTAGKVPEESDQGSLIPLEDLVHHRILGEGQFGIVWLVTNRNDEDMDPYALKIQQVDDPNRPDSGTAIRKEVETMKALHCPFIVKIFCTYENPQAISMLMSVAPGGELFDLVHQEDEDGMWHSGLQEPHASFFATIIADVMAFMHHQRYLYRDLKPENVLIDQDGYPVITDFGFAKRMDGDADTKTYTFCGTPQYLCPEITLHRGHSYPADNWTIGVLIYELILGENPFFEPGVDSTILYDTICNKPPFFDESDPISEGAKSLIFKLLEKDPNKRLGTFREKDILEDPWLSQYKISRLRSKRVPAPWVPDPVEFEEI